MKLSSQPATPQSPIAHQDLISLAREILQTPTEESLRDPEMATEEDTIVVQQESPTSYFTAVNDKEPSSNGNGNGESTRRTPTRGQMDNHGSRLLDKKN